MEVALNPKPESVLVGAIRFLDEKSVTRTVGLIRKDGVLVIDWSKDKPSTFLGYSTPKYVDIPVTPSARVPPSFVLDNIGRCDKVR